MGRQLLILASILSAAIAALHVVIVFVGAPAYRYFGAGEEMASRAESGSLLPPLLTLTIALVFAVFAAYALSAAVVIQRLPLLKLGLVAIGVIYSLRGLLVFGQVAYVIRHELGLLHGEIVFSAVSLITGMVYVMATILEWRSIGQRVKAAG
jgi:hypothetical protein